MDITGFALVTGAGSGIGRACAVAFALEGAAGVALLDINADNLQNVKAEVKQASTRKGFKCLTLTVNVSNEIDVTSAFHECANQFGRLDYVVNCAGIAHKQVGGVAYAQTSDWQRVMDINLNGVFYSVRAATQIMLKQDWLISSINGSPRQRGSIVNISSIMGLVGIQLSTAYVPSKHAVIGLTKTTALDYAAQGLRVNAVCPGYISTPLINTSKEVVQRATEQVETFTPMKRWGSAQEIANAVLFLSGGRSSFITGSAVTVDGGYTAQ